MKNRLHISAVGTSLLSNMETSHKDEIKKFGYEGWGRYPPDHQKQSELLARARKGDQVFDFALSFIKERGGEASAELSTLLDPSTVDKSRDEIRLYPTHTGNSSFAAQVLYEYLKQEGYRVHDPSQTRLTRHYLESEDEFGETLFSLMDKVGGDIAEYNEKGWMVYIHASAGFKPETTFMVLIGSLMGADKIIYRHESFRQVVSLPALKLRIDDALLKELQGFRSPVPKNIAEQWTLTPYGLSELIEVGYLKVIPSGYVLREWLKKYLEKTKP